MAVPCRRCGREYDVALFEFGRTLQCTCGARVGIEPRVRQVAPASAERFAADAMLGRLARWLRLLGLDCTHDPEIADGQLVRHALAEGRTILTRDRGLPREWWIPGIYVVGETEVARQLVEVIRRFELTASIRVLTRCSACNRPLEELERSAVRGRVPPGVLERHAAFSACPACGRVYWEGSHAARIRRVAEGLTTAAGLPIH